MPTVTGSSLKALFAAALALLCFYQAREVATVDRAWIGEGQEVRLGVDVDDDRYLAERRKARRQALPYYGGAAIAGLVALGYGRKAWRIHERNQRRYPHDFTRRY